MREYLLLVICYIISILHIISSIAVDITNSDIAYASSRAIVYDFVSVETKNVSPPIKQVHFGNPGHPSDVEYLIRFDNGSQWNLILQLNTQLIPNKFQCIHHDPLSGNKIIGNSIEHCFYHGYLRQAGEDDSMVAVSTCNGLHGTVYSKGEIYIIQPTSQHSPKKYFVHSIKDEHPSPYSVCGTETQQPQDPIHVIQQFKEHKMIRRTTFSKFVELYLTIDNSLYELISSDTTLSRQYAIEIANEMDLMYKTIGVRVAIVGVQIWSSTDQITVNRDLDITLNNWLQYLPTLKAQTSFTYDNAQLIIGLEFPSNNVIGKAPVGSMCFELSGGVNRDTAGNNALRIASTVSHEMGHNFGMQHDEDRSCYVPCTDGCVMNAVSSGQPATEFSPCSVDDLNTNLADGVGFCIFNEPTNLATDPVCGNGFIESGEQCDCGPIATCDSVDPCCEPGQCMLKPGAQCATGECCTDCQYSSSTQECRVRGNICDLAEYCTGSDSLCPNNILKRDGLPCTVSTGDSFCYQGDCKTLTGQCNYLWGVTSSVGANICFDELNINGDTYGNCGDDGNSFIACALADVRCGKVHCTNISSGDFQLSGNVLYSTVTFYGSVEAVCEGASVDVGNDVPDPGLVFDGTLCGTDSICKSQSCITLQSLNLPTCPDNNGMECSGNGVCTNEIVCVCNNGFSGSDCSMTEPITTQTTITTPSSTVSAQTTITTPSSTVSAQTTITTPSSTASTQPSTNTTPGSSQPTVVATDSPTVSINTNYTTFTTVILPTVPSPIFNNVYFQVGVGLGGGVLLLLISAACLLCICCICVRSRKKNKNKYIYNNKDKQLQMLTGSQYSPLRNVYPHNVTLEPTNYPGPPPTPPMKPKPSHPPSTKPALPPNKPKSKISETRVPV
ncbi:hypothetical protein LOD99_8157 [Oopsacas minuta]|uniref:Uncharacterized protein n=1 Tax=Oopsacas minuta TaxID=111878 RepID=A0AAV7JI27_9METZ|nr:hypothetical protein LOD99_8157 [Oopsacas minuta]